MRLILSMGYTYQYTVEFFDAWRIYMERSINWESKLDVEVDKQIRYWRRNVLTVHYEEKLYIGTEKSSNQLGYLQVITEGLPKYFRVIASYIVERKFPLNVPPSPQIPLPWITPSLYLLLFLLLALYLYPFSPF